jgi:predicted HD superfamily hydrolase involved in NAD metabolism
MIQVKDVLPVLRKALDTQRYIHSLGTMALAVLFAPQFGADPDKAALSGILHDCAKCLPKETLLRMAKEYGWDTGEGDRYLPILHGEAGAVLARIEYGVSDPEVLSAITWHVTGKPGMSPLAKTVYLADLIEPGRKYPGVADIRRLARRDINEAMIQGTEKVIEYVRNKQGMTMHPASIEMLQWLKEEKEEMD